MALLFGFYLGLLGSCCAVIKSLKRVELRPLGPHRDCVRRDTALCAVPGQSGHPDDGASSPCGLSMAACAQALPPDPAWGVSGSSVFLKPWLAMPRWLPAPALPLPFMVGLCHLHVASSEPPSPCHSSSVTSTTHGSPCPTVTGPWIQ